MNQAEYLEDLYGGDFDSIRRLDHDGQQEEALEYLRAISQDENKALFWMRLYDKGQLSFKSLVDILTVGEGVGQAKHLNHDSIGGAKAATVQGHVPIAIRRAVNFVSCERPTPNPYYTPNEW